MGNVARPKATQGESKTTRGEGLVPRSKQSGTQPWSQSTVEKSRRSEPSLRRKPESSGEEIPYRRNLFPTIHPVPLRQTIITPLCGPQKAIGDSK